MEMVEGLEVLLDNVEEFEFSRGVPDDVGYVLRSPAHLMVNMKLS
jgi:hypothetical protein